MSIQQAKQLIAKGSYTKAYDLGLKIKNENHLNNDFHEMMAFLTYKLQKFSESELYTQQALTKSKTSDLYTNLGLSQLKQQKVDEAIISLKKALELAPDNINALNNLGTAYGIKNNHHKALNTFLKSIKVKQNNFGGVKGAGIAFGKVGNLEMSIKYLENAIAIQNDLSTQLALAYVYLSTLNNDNACKIYEKFINQLPFSASTQYLYSLCCKENGRDYLIKNLEDYLKNIDILEEDKIKILFALGNHYNAMKKYNKAFENYNLANSIKFKSIPKDVRYINSITNFKNLYINNPIDENLISPLNDTPIFIFGMSRSGKSLLNKLITQSSKINTVYENEKLESIIASVLPKYKEFSLEGLNKETSRKIGEDYIKLIKSLSNTKSDEISISNCLGSNYIHSELISKIFPKAKFIHVARNPYDLLLANYFRSYSEVGHLYTYDFKYLAKYYSEYFDSIRYYEKVLPNFLTIQYEELILRTESTLSKVANFLNLNPKEIMPAEPLFNSEVGFSDNYIQYTCELKNLIKSLG